MGRGKRAFGFGWVVEPPASCCSWPAKTFGDAAFAPGATASSGLAVSYASSNTDVATISGKLTITYIRRKSATTPGIGSAIPFSDTPATWDINPAATESGVSPRMNRTVAASR